MRIGVNLLNLQQDRYGGVGKNVVPFISPMVKIQRGGWFFFFFSKTCREMFSDY